MLKKFYFVVIINIILLFFIELSVKFFLKFLNLPTVYKVQGIGQNRYDYLTGYYNNPNQKEKIFNNSYKQATDRYGFNIDGERKDKDLYKKEKDEFRIFVLGGSTTQGRSLIDKFDPITARVEKKLNNLKIERAKFVLINTGATSLITSQTVNLAKDRIMYSLKPDMLIFLGGTNDATNPPGKELYLSNSHSYQRAFQENIKYNSKNLFYFIDDFFSKNLSTYFLIKKIIEKTTGKIFYEKEFRVNKEINPKENSFTVKTNVKRYLYNIEVLSKLASEDVPILVFFAPQMLPNNYSMLISKDKKIYDQQQQKHPGYFENKQFFFNKISKNFKNRNSFEKSNKNFYIFDISKILNVNDSNNQYFSDHVHYTPFSREIIASRIYEEIIKINNLRKIK